MDNRGSKFFMYLIKIKEQRVDGTGYIIFIIYLRCTLEASKGVYIRKVI